MPPTIGYGTQRGKGSASSTKGLPGLTARYKRILRKLFPIGPLWNNINSTFESLLEAIAVEPARVHESSNLLMKQANPATSVLSGGLLAEWEDAVLLPAELPAIGASESQRQQVVTAKVNTIYSGPTKQFFLDLAAKLGMVISGGGDKVIITDGGAVTGARVGVGRVGVGRVGGPGTVFLWTIVIQTNADPSNQRLKLVELLKPIKPAHTRCKIYYPDSSTEVNLIGDI